MLSIQELQKLSIQELNEEFIKASSNLFKTRFEVGTGSNKASHEISKLRKYRAQIKTYKKDLESQKTAELKAQKEVVEAPKEETDAK